MLKLLFLVEYAAAVVYEVREGTTSNDPIIRMRFKNGTNDVFNTYNMFGQSSDIPLSLFKSKLQFAAINTTAEWCIACANSQDRGCGTCDNPALASAAASAKTAVHHHTLSPAAAGVVGAAVTAVVILLALIVLGFLGLVSVGRKARTGAVHSRVCKEFMKSLTTQLMNAIRCIALF